ncbi:MAG TPA: hypothetical protein VJ889_17390 [Pseudomonas sp.]|nr:hypothetical protein [Pseudomonas sp.]
MPDTNTYTDEQVLQLTEDAIGLSFSAPLLRLVEKLTGRSVRPTGRNFVATLDYRPKRLNLDVNDCGIIVSATFG